MNRDKVCKSRNNIIDIYLLNTKINQYKIFNLLVNDKCFLAGKLGSGSGVLLISITCSRKTFQRTNYLKAYLKQPKGLSHVGFWSKSLPEVGGVGENMQVYEMIWVRSRFNLFWKSEKRFLCQRQKDYALWK